MSIDSLNEMAEGFTAQKDAFIAQAQAQLQPALLNVFKDHPEILKYSWTQYTPYFNDGSPCVFHVGDVTFLDQEYLDECINEHGYEDESDLDEWDYCYGKDHKYQSLLKVSKFLCENEEICLECFGNDVKVIVTPTGVEVEEYDHD